MRAAQSILKNSRFLPIILAFHKNDRTIATYHSVIIRFLPYGSMRVTEARNPHALRGDGV